MVDFTEIAATVSNVIAAEGLGAPVVLTRKTPDAYDAATGVAAVTTTIANVVGTVEEVRGRELMAGLAQAGDKRVSIPAAQLSAAPKPGDSLTALGVSYVVVRVETVTGGAVAILYVLTCRVA
jgi:hypothetical protein